MSQPPMQPVNQNIDPSYQFCFEEIIDQIDNEQKSLTNRKLLEICRKIGNFLRGEINPHHCHEITEAALNYLIQRKYAKNLFAAQNPTEIVRDLLKPLALRLPTQSWRSQGQKDWQQFSTPPGVAYLLTYLLNLKAVEKVLEPSAGTGNLAVWTSGAEIKTYTNEIDPRRRILLHQIGFTPTAFNAEFINDFLPPDISVDCVLMNPPFSSNGGRTKNNSSKFGFRHVESALERLKKGGKFGVILGEAGGLDTKTGNDFWRKLCDRIEVSAVIKINGREYVKNGTTVDINLIIGNKLLVPQKTDWNQMLNKIISFSANTVEEAFAKAETFNFRLNR
jgi:type I restriction-modification system DNA methylase subunit